MTSYSTLIETMHLSCSIYPPSNIHHLHCSHLTISVHNVYATSRATPLPAVRCRAVCMFNHKCASYPEQTVFSHVPDLQIKICNILEIFVTFCVFIASVGTYCLFFFLLNRYVSCIIFWSKVLVLGDQKHHFCE